MKFRIHIAFLFLVGFCALTFFSLMHAGAVSEGTQGEGIHALVSQIFTGFYTILRFPTHYLFWDYMDGDLFLWGLFINCIFFAVLSERIVAYIKMKREKINRP